MLNWVFRSVVALAGVALLAAPGIAEASEKSACIGVEEDAKRVSVLTTRDVIGVEVLKKRVGKQMVQRTQGAVLHLAPQPGDSAALLERILRCQAAMGVNLAENDPLALKDVNVSVAEHKDRFAVLITSGKTSVAKKIAQRAQHVHERAVLSRAQ